MAYKSKAWRKTKDLREPIEGNGTRMAPGSAHLVTLSNTVFTANDKKILLALEDGFGNTHLEEVFLLDKTEEALGFITSQLIAAIAKDSAELKLLCDGILEGNASSIMAHVVGRSCIIETGYRDKFVNLKSIRRSDDRNNSGSIVQPIETDAPPADEPDSPARSFSDARLSPLAASFF